MAKISGPGGGETEFFQITELQQAFEKELKTGEKIAVIPGVKEASFLREAPIRSELQKQWENFKDRVLNPPVPPQPEVPRPICPAVFFNANSSFDLSVATGSGFNPASTPILIAEWVWNLPTSLGGLPYFSGTFTSPGTWNGANFTFPSMTINAPLFAPAPGYVTQVIPNALTVNLKIKDVVTVAGFAGIAGITLSESWPNYFTQAFNCANIPDTIGPQELLLCTLSADVQEWYYTANPNPCTRQFINFAFTNNYP
ncbi:MAG: hypothetical protein EBR40_09150 [Proteobacteria bacterium]|nr:hypothetical protein [Pseudomonadota bacterium]